MNIRVRQKQNVVILDIQGVIDVNAAPLIETVGKCINDGYNDILCDLSEVTTLDYMGVSCLVIAYKDVTNNGGRMKLVSVPLHLQGVLSVAGIDKVIESYATEEQALHSFKEDRAIEHIQKMQLRRRFKRLPVGIKAHIITKHSTKPVEVSMMNLSAIGAFLYGCDNCKLGDEVTLVIRISSSHEPVFLDSTVVWLPDKQLQHQLHPGMGVEFSHITQDVQQKLLTFIERNLSSMTAE
jgi:anti-sigma B factor antagonist